MAHSCHQAFCYNFVYLLQVSLTFILPWVSELIAIPKYPYKIWWISHVLYIRLAESPGLCSKWAGNFMECTVFVLMYVLDVEKYIFMFRPSRCVRKKVWKISFDMWHLFNLRVTIFYAVSLTRWGQATLICVGKLTIIGSDNGLSPGRRQAMIWINDVILLIGSLGTNFSEILIGNQTFSFKKMHLKMSSAKWRPFYFGLNLLNE